MSTAEITEARASVSRARRRVQLSSRPPRISQTHVWLADLAVGSDGEKDASVRDLEAAVAELRPEAPRMSREEFLKMRGRIVVSDADLLFEESFSSGGLLSRI